jgi:ribosomal RNA-processing protein 8
MSLFASAFDTGAGPSSTPIAAPNLGKAHKDGKNKKKRTSLPNHDLRATEANLAKLMKKVEAGDIKSKREGGESMGLGGEGPAGRGKKGQGKANGAGHSIEADVEPTPAAQPDGKKRKRDSLGGVNASPHATTPNAKSETPVKLKKGEKPPPAELPLPHAIPKKDLHSEAVKDEKLTDMQRSMQAKLEGARFR